MVLQILITLYQKDIFLSKQQVTAEIELTEHTQSGHRCPGKEYY